MEPNSASHRSTRCAPASDSPMSRRVLQERRHPLEDAASMRGVAEIKTFGKFARPCLIKRLRLPRDMTEHIPFAAGHAPHEQQRDHGDAPQYRISRGCSRGCGGSPRSDPLFAALRLRCRCLSRPADRAPSEQPGYDIAPCLLFRDVERGLPRPRRGPVQIGAVGQQVLSGGELPAMACVPERP